MHARDDNLFVQDKDRDQKLEDVTAAVLESVQNLCQCGFLRDRITGGEFRCFSASPQTVTYRAMIHGTASTNSSQLISHIEQWTDRGTNLIIQQTVLRVNGSSTDATTTLEDEECPLSNSNSPTTSKSNDNCFTFIGGALVIGIIAGVSVTSFIAIIICCVLRHRAHSVKKNVESSPGIRYTFLTWLYSRVFFLTLLIISFITL